MNKVGIDLGTSNSVICTWLDGQEIFIYYDGKIIIPSYIYIDHEKDEILVGYRAKAREKTEPDKVVSSTKRWIGNNSKFFQIDGEEYTAEDVTTIYLTKLKENCDTFFSNDEGIEAVVTVPGDMPTTGVEATKRAAKRAGFVNVTILKEPLASVIAHDLLIREPEKSLEPGYCFVADLGGGTYDVALIRYGMDKRKYNVVSVSGDMNLGGNDFTDILIKEIYEEIKNSDAYFHLDFYQESIEEDEQLKEIFQDNKFYLRKKAEIAYKAEIAKQEFSTRNEVDILINELFTYEDKNYSFRKTITLDDYKISCHELIKRIHNANSKMNIGDIQITNLIIVGGGMNLPFVKESISTDIPHKNVFEKDYDTIVARGACYRAYNPQILINNIINYSIGIRLKDDSIYEIIPAGYEYPITKECESYFSNWRDGQTTMNIQIYEGNNLKNALAEDNQKLTNITIDNVISGKVGTAKIKVILAVNEQGVLNIDVCDMKNKNNHIGKSCQRKNIGNN